MVIYEAINRVAEKGAAKIYVGSDQEFYFSLGFKKEFISNVWEKIL